MELVVRLHRMLRQARTPYRIVFVPDPICWTEAPEDLRTLARQRIRWQRGLGESLGKNIELMTQRNAGIVGRVAFPFNLVFELFGPLLEVDIVLSTSALLLEEASFHIYPGLRGTLVLFDAAVLENFGYRQMNSVWRLIGVLRWLRGGQAKWGEMRRSGRWSKTRE